MGARPVLTQRISSARAHCSAFTFGIRAGLGRRGGTPAADPREVRRRGAGTGRRRGGGGGSSCAPRPGPAVQPGSRPSGSLAPGADSLSWQPGGAGPEETIAGTRRSRRSRASSWGRDSENDGRGGGRSRRRGFRRGGAGRGGARRGGAGQFVCDVKLWAQSQKKRIAV